MRLGPIAIKLRLANTRFETRVAGATELELAVNNTLSKDSAFVVPIADDCPKNQYDNHINQTITERFGVVVALANDSTDKDKTGITAFDLIHEVRNEIHKAILGWMLQDAESIIFYRGGRILGNHRAYLWYVFEFEYESRLSDFPDENLERDRHRTFSKFSNWEIVCQEILDTRHSHVYYQGCFNELRKRGKSEQEVFDMRKLAWQTVGWLNYPMALWEWVGLDESDILLAIKWLYQYKQINLQQCHELERFVERHAY